MVFPELLDMNQNDSNPFQGSISQDFIAVFIYQTKGYEKLERYGWSLKQTDVYCVWAKLFSTNYVRLK